MAAFQSPHTIGSPSGPSGTGGPAGAASGLTTATLLPALPPVAGGAASLLLPQAASNTSTIELRIILMIRRPETKKGPALPQALTI